MQKLNQDIYDRLLLRAEEAKNRGMTKLASGILGALGPMPEEEAVLYDYARLKEDIYRQLWKVAACVLKYHDANSVEAEKLDRTLSATAIRLFMELEDDLGMDHSQIGPLESKVPGRS